MTDKYYDVYFDPAELVVDRDGELENPEALHIIELEYDAETERIICGQRVDKKGNTISEPMEWDEVFNLSHVGYGDDVSIRDALSRFEDWLKGHTVWVETNPETRWQPAEYACIGIEGFVDDGNPY